MITKKVEGADLADIRTTPGRLRETAMELRAWPREGANAG
jgi:hypothetical protein